MTALIVRNRVTIATVDYRPSDRTYIARRAATDRLVAIADNEHAARTAAHRDHTGRSTAAICKPPRTVCRLSSMHGRMLRRRGELIRLAGLRRDWPDLAKLAWVMADCLAFGRLGVDYETFQAFARKMATIKQPKRASHRRQ
jgi:hypothetical protein